MSDDTVRLRPWTNADLAAELRNNTPELTAFLGGPLDEGVVRRRRERLLRGQAVGTAVQFTLWAGGEDAAVSTAGCCSSTPPDAAAPA